MMKDFLSVLNQLAFEMGLTSEETVELYSKSLDYTEKAMKYLPADSNKWTEEKITQAYQRSGAPKLENLALKVKSMRYQKKSDSPTSKPVINLAILGEAEHGKSTLTSALTKYCALTEKGRFYTYDEIDDGTGEKRAKEREDHRQVEFETGRYYYKIVDIPGDPRYINSIFGIAPNIDAAILVVSVCEYRKETTAKHVALARNLGIPMIVVFLNKMDRMDHADPGFVVMEIQGLLEQFHYSIEKSQIVFGSASNALQSAKLDCDAEEYLGLHQLIDVLDEDVQPFEPVQSEPLFMVINDLHPLSESALSAAVMVTGGQLNVGQHVEIVGSEHLSALVTNVEPYHSKPGEALTGSNYWITLEGVEPERVTTGMVVSEPNLIDMAQTFIGDLEVPDWFAIPESWLREGTDLYFGSRHIAGRLKVLRRYLSGRRDRMRVEVSLEEPTALQVGELFGVASSSAAYGTGKVGRILK